MFTTLRFAVTNCPWVFTKRALEHPKNVAEFAIVVLSAVTHQSSTADLNFLFARVVGGFVTSESRVREAIRIGAENSPQGISYGGIIAKKLEVGFSPALRARRP